MRKTILFVVLALVLALPACGGGATPTPSTSTDGQPAGQPPASAAPVVLRVGWLGFPDTLNPAYAFLTESYTMFDLVYSTLTTQSPDGEYVGLLAEDRSVSEDGLTWACLLYTSDAADE